MSSPPPPPSGFPPSPLPSGSPPPPPPPPPPPTPTQTSANAGSTITSANYFFGFVITFVVLLLLFVGCGVGSWRRFRIIGTAWDERMQAMEGSTVVGRKRFRRRLVRPVFWELWTSTKGMAHLAPETWQAVQPISAAAIWSRSQLVAAARESEAAGALESSEREVDEPVRSISAMLRAFVFPRRSRCDAPKRTPVQRPPPEAIQVAVMIAMPSPPTTPIDQPSYVGHASGGEYQVGVVRISWPSGDGP